MSSESLSKPMELVYIPYIYHANPPNAGKYTYPMDPMGIFYNASYLPSWHISRVVKSSPPTLRFDWLIDPSFMGSNPKLEDKQLQEHMI